jgi:hypothetical protein
MAQHLSAYRRFQNACTTHAADAPGASRGAVERAVFTGWIGEAVWDDLIAYCHEAFDPGGGDWELLELSFALSESGEDARLDALWHGVIAQRSENLRWRRGENPEQIRAELPAQYGPPLSIY